MRPVNWRHACIALLGTFSGKPSLSRIIASGFMSDVRCLRFCPRSPLRLFGTFNLVTSVTANAASPSDRLNRAAYLAASTRNAAFPVRDSIFDQACDFAHWHLSDLSDHADDRGKSDIAVPSAGPEMTKAVVHQLALACSDGF
jgi:hypothetical protein